MARRRRAVSWPRAARAARTAGVDLDHRPEHRRRRRRHGGAPLLMAAQPDAAAAARALADRTKIERHDLALVLGSGWRETIDGLGRVVARTPIAELPGFSPPTV